jgi:hypothetical protein
VPRVARAAGCAFVALALGAALCAGATAKAPAKPRPPALADSASFDARPLQRLLDDYLVVTSEPGAPLETRFDYAKLIPDVLRDPRLRGIRDTLLRTSPARMSPRQRHAWAIDTYNFLVVQLVTQNVLVRTNDYKLKHLGISQIAHASPRDIRVDGMPLFDAEVVTVDGKSYSLADFERAFVFDGYPAAQGNVAPPATLDPRAHYALVNGALGAPPLRPRAFLAESLDAQLDQATRDVLANPRYLRIDPAQGVMASPLFDWHASDFGGPQAAFEFVKRYAPDSLRAVLGARQRIEGTIAWDWDLNKVDRPPQLPQPLPPRQK